jgi:alpha-ketoglutarate-dependent taurine dioxygenase
MIKADENMTLARAVSPQLREVMEPLHGFEFARDGHHISRRDLWRLRSAVLGRLCAYPYFALVKDCPGIENRKDFCRVSRSFGRFPPDTARWQRLFGRVPKSPITEIKCNPETAKETKYVTRYSRTSQALAPHTDGSARYRPYDIVIMYCVTADDEGGETILVPLDDVVAKLERDHYEILHASTYPFGKNVFPIIETNRGQDTIRYYSTQMQKSAKLLGEEWLVGAEDSLEALDAALEDPEHQIRLKLQPGDLLFVNNRKTLHGRTKMSSESERLLLRARVFSDKVL